MKRLVSLVIFISFAAGSLGQPACPEDSGGTALIVIDMQPGFVTRGGSSESPENQVKVQKVLEEQVGAIRHAGEAGIPILFLEYEGSFGPTNQVLRDTAKNYQEVRYFIKDTDGMFEAQNSNITELVDYLRSKKIGKLIITGANGGACVRRSIVGALDNNCTVVAFTHGIADFNYKKFIYPYNNKYKFQKPKCRNCTFREAHSLGVVEQVISGAANARQNAQPPVQENSEGVR